MLFTDQALASVLKAAVCSPKEGYIAVITAYLPDPHSRYEKSTHVRSGGRDW